MLLFARQFVRNREDAEDVVQEAFSKMWRSGAIAEGGDRMIGKFYGCIRWAALDWLRKNKRRSRREDFAAQSDVLEKGGGYFERALETEELAETVQGALCGLPEAQREVVTLKIWSELTFEQIGQALDVSPNTAASRFRYAMKALKRQLKGVVNA